MQIALSGNIGAGKTSCAGILSAALGGEVRLESVEDNPYLAPFYSDQRRWAFHLQIYMLTSRLQQSLEATQSGGLVFLDRTVLEDREIFALNLYRCGMLSEADWRAYNHIHSLMEPHFDSPNLYLYLRASVPTLERNIARRSRDCESGISRDYLEDLQVLYEALFVRLQAEVRVLVLDMDKLDVSRSEDAARVVEMVREAMRS